jgi:hypothetical protein
MSGALFAPLFQLGYQCSPIILVGGLAQNIPGQMLPIVCITEGISLLTGALAGNFPTSMDDFFAQFTVVPSGRLITQQIGHYAFANQAVAANATVTEPLTVSVRMDCPAKGAGEYVAKLAVLTALQAALSAHNSAGGLYTIATPSFIYTNCIMTTLTDISGGVSAQVQYQWQFDFEQPLVRLQAAQQAYSALLNKIAGGTQISDPAWSSPEVAAASPVSGASSQVQGGGALTGTQTGVAAPVMPVTVEPLEPTLPGSTPPGYNFAGASSGTV